jgi:serine phosphatase RsbU (regulator of sigma subunit)
MQNIVFWVLLLLGQTAWCSTDSLQVLISSKSKDTVQVDLLNDKGRDLLRTDPISALKCSERALVLSQEINYKSGEGRAANNLGNILGSQGKYSISLNYYQHALAIRDSLNDLKGVASTLNNIANIYQIQRLFTEALQYVRKSLAVRVSIKDSLGISLAHQALGNIYNGMQQSDSAIYHMRIALNFANALQNDLLISDGYSNLGGAFGYKQQFDSAGYYLNRAIELKKQIGDKINLPTSMYSYISTILLPYNRLNEAIAMGEEGLKIAEEVHSAESVFQMQFLLSGIYALTGDFKKAYDLTIRAQLLKDSVQSRSVLEKITKMEMQAQFDQQLKEQSFREQAQEREVFLQRIALMMALIALFVSMFFGWSFFRQSKIRKKANQELVELNSSILKQNELIQLQQEGLSSQHKTITDSIQYASRIQQAILPAHSEFNQLFPKGSIWYLPKDVVSGDFYWTERVQEYTFLVIGDGTGHGVPGAFMSLIGINLLNEVILKDKILDPDRILFEIDRLLRNTLHSTDGREMQDGMDMAIIRIGPGNEILFSGASRPLWVLSKGELAEYKTSHYSLGGMLKLEKEFNSISVPTQAGDFLISFTDGITDQFGGDNKRKITSQGLRNLLHSSTYSDSDSLVDSIQQYYFQWKGETRQIDDIVVACFQI